MPWIPNSFDATTWRHDRCRIIISAYSASKFLHGNGLTLYSAKAIIVPHRKKYEVGTLAVDGWDVTFGTARRGFDGLRPRPVPFLLYQM